MIPLCSSVSSNQPRTRPAVIYHGLLTPEEMPLRNREHLETIKQ